MPEFVGKMQFYLTLLRQPIGQPITGHTDEVLSVAFSPDGHRIVSGSPTTPYAVEREHRPTDRPAAHRPHRTGDQRGVQPRRHAHRLRQCRQDSEGVGRGHRPTLGHR